MLRVVLVLTCLCLLSACSQWWQVRPYPEFVLAEIKPGDKIRITTKKGLKADLVVIAVDRTQIVGADQSYPLNDIAKLEKRGKSPPANPCSPQKRLECSLPTTVELLHESQSYYKDYFYPSCEQHDYCYRHGNATYGVERVACDRQFLEDMQQQCSPRKLSVFLLDSESNPAECSAVALAYYQAVSKLGEKNFRTTGSTYCEYDGPP
jgi:hypothetical protein